MGGLDLNKIERLQCIHLMQLDTFDAVVVTLGQEFIFLKLLRGMLTYSFITCLLCLYHRLQLIDELMLR